MEDILARIGNAQSLYAIAIANLLDRAGLVSIDEFTKELEELNGKDGEPTLVAVEAVIDALRKRQSL